MTRVQNSLSDGFSGDGVKPSWALPVSNLACATTALAVMVLIGELVVLLVLESVSAYVIVESVMCRRRM